MKTILRTSLLALALAMATTSYAKSTLVGVEPMLEAQTIDRVARTVTIPIQVTRAGQGVLKVRLAFSSDLPAGCVATFTPNPVVFKGNKPAVKMTELIISVPVGGVTAGAYNYTITVTNGVTRKVDTFVGVLQLPDMPPLEQQPVLKINSSVVASASTGSATGVPAINPPQIHLKGTPHRTYMLQATTDLANPSWIDLATVTADANGDCAYIDTEAFQYNPRFYRAKAQ
jgi:hypothetical protein